MDQKGTNLYQNWTTLDQKRPFHYEIKDFKTIQNNFYRTKKELEKILLFKIHLNIFHCDVLYKIFNVFPLEKCMPMGNLAGLEPASNKCLRREEGKILITGQEEMRF